MGRKRVLPSGMWDRDDVYYARFRAGGRLVRKRLSTDFDAASQLLNELRARADRADFDIVDNDCAYTELKGEFLKWARQSVRGAAKYEQDLEKFEQFTNVRSIREITPQLVISFREWRLSQTVGAKGDNPHTVSPRTVNRQVGTLNNMLNHGVRWGRIGSNALTSLAPLAHDSHSKQRRALTVCEVEALFEASPDHLRPVWRMFMCTGVRRTELVELKFSDVDFENRTLTISASRSKNRKAREIPLDDTLLAMLADLQAAAKNRQPVAGLTPAITAKQAARFSRDHVFVSKANTPLRNNLLRRFYAICKRAGIDGAEQGGAVDIHSLRVTFTTLSLEHGANPKAVQSILGHSTLAMTMSVYARATERSKREAISALPFASATKPKHIISVQDERALSTEAKATSQRQVAQ